MLLSRLVFCFFVATPGLLVGQVSHPEWKIKSTKDFEVVGDTTGAFWKRRLG